ncbi:hypothetical protein ITJ64_18525 [Herbiconiux sp. VKM Ac-1786]|uniref:PfkB family carbohydrate kinase n=1 Tax=Herbiconiux sp. VKM Ac-1786 TaxID=2783824 RepID=UPI00188A1A61|nr:PfkB family carbohydrate kinase [Herbiconiux sp. VKM Ac-1786]MBF4574512.1 hypothetical protein [Herbiconiux sp. VKM Ac-1786]
MSNIVVIGETLIDVAVTGANSSETPASGPVDVALHLAQLGHQVILRTALAADARGDFARSQMIQAGVKIVVTDIPRTSTTTANADQVEHDLTWALDDAPLVSSDAVHTGSIAAWLPPGTWRVEALLERARPGSIISLEAGIRPMLIRNASDARQRIRRITRLADIVKLTDEELGWLWPDLSEKQVVTTLLEQGAAVVIVTLPTGWRTYTKNHLIESAVPLPSDSTSLGKSDPAMGWLLNSVAEHGLLNGDMRTQLQQMNESALQSIFQSINYVRNATASLAP